MNVLESLGKVVFGPLTPRGGVGGDPPPHSRAYLVPWCLEGGLGGPSPILGTKLAALSKEGGWGDPPPMLGRNWSLARGLGVGWACPAHLYLISPLSLRVSPRRHILVRPLEWTLHKLQLVA